jgi:integrase
MNDPIDSKNNLMTGVSTSLVVENLETLVAGVKELVDAADAGATTRAYAADWRVFEAWCTSKRLPVTLPIDPDIVATYLRALYNRGRKVKTIERALAGIVHRHRAADAEWLTPDRIRREIRGIRKTRRKAGERPTKKTALTKDKLVTFLAQFGSKLIDLRDRALLLLTWDTASRESETVGLEITDITFVPQQGLVIEPRSTKTDQEGKDSAQAVEFAADPALCPIVALRAWLEAANITEGPIFRPITKQGKVQATQLSTRAFRVIVKKRAAAAGFDAATFSGHSLRSGWITEARRAGRDMTAIMSRSKHKSEAMVREYIHYEDLFKKNASKGLL